jgi:hypothetical protein
VIVKRRCLGRSDEWSAVVAWVVTAAAVSLFLWAVPLNAADTDPDLQAVQAVCGRCHTTAIFLNKPRSWSRWNDVFADMTQRGARGTDEQLTRVTRFFLENLTLVNVNNSPADELGWVLGVSDDVAQAIIARRQQQPFANIAQLRAMPGVEPGKLDRLKDRILF